MNTKKEYIKPVTGNTFLAALNMMVSSQTETIEVSTETEEEGNAEAHKRLFDEEVSEGGNNESLW